MTVAVPFLDLTGPAAPLRPALDAAWHRVQDSGRFVLGPELEAFEAEFAATVGCAQAVGVGNGDRKSVV